MATIITLPKIIGLDTELCVPEGNQRLWNYFSVEGYSVKHSKIFEPHLFMPTNRSNLPYQKMVDRYQFLTSDGVKLQCAPLCPEGWYFDCATETCKEYDWYRLSPTGTGGILTVETGEGEKVYSQDSLHPWDWGWYTEVKTTAHKEDLLGGNYISYALYRFEIDHSADMIYLDSVNDMYQIDVNLLYTDPNWRDIWVHNQSVPLFTVKVEIPLVLTFGKN